LSAGVPAIVRRFLLTTDEELRLAKLVLPSSTNHAAKFAYMAAFHAAHAALLSFTGDVPKTHKGVRNAFALLAKDTKGLGADLGRFLAQAYEYKEAADYRLEAPISTGEANGVMTKAADLLQKVKSAVAKA
jgi:uncharacterized protein (UPF0332 family)